MMAAYDNIDGDTILGLSSPDIQVVDELSRRWMRGVGELKDYFNSVPQDLSDVSSTLNDVNESVFGETAVVTYWLEQDYKVNGEPQHVSAPTTVLLRRENSAWRAVLIHTIPLAES
jgi:ketosteroid isomerase-like protein